MRVINLSWVLMGFFVGLTVSFIVEKTRPQKISDQFAADVPSSHTPLRERSVNTERRSSNREVVSMPQTQSMSQAAHSENNNRGVNHLYGTDAGLFRQLTIEEQLNTLKQHVESGHVEDLFLLFEQLDQPIVEKLSTLSLVLLESSPEQRIHFIQSSGITDYLTELHTSNSTARLEEYQVTELVFELFDSLMNDQPELAKPTIKALAETSPDAYASVANHFIIESEDLLDASELDDQQIQIASQKLSNSSVEHIQTTLELLSEPRRDQTLKHLVDALGWAEPDKALNLTFDDEALNTDYQRALITHQFDRHNHAVNDSPQPIDSSDELIDQITNNPELLDITIAQAAVRSLQTVGRHKNPASAFKQLYEQAPDDGTKYLLASGAANHFAGLGDTSAVKQWQQRAKRWQPE